MTTKYTYILYTGAVEAGRLSEANKAASGGEWVGWLRVLYAWSSLLDALLGFGGGTAVAI